MNTDTDELTRNGIREGENKYDAMVRRIVFVITMPIKFPLCLLFIFYIMIRQVTMWLVAGKDTLFDDVPGQKTLFAIMDWPL